MVTISLCMIVKNEEDVLFRCLDSVKNIVDEIVIVDTGSSDKTKKIAKEFTDQVYDFEWICDFAAARNFAFSKATKDYLLWLDADDVIEGENIDKFLILKNQLSPAIDSIRMRYNLIFDLNNKPIYFTIRNRLVKRERNFKWVGFVHEYLEVYGLSIDADIGISHRKIAPHTSRNLKIYELHEASGKEFSPRDLFYFGNELLDNAKLEKAIVYYNKFLESKKGWIEDIMTCCIKLSKCYGDLGDAENKIKSLLRATYYDVPRAEICCKLGKIFFEKGEYPKAIYWYKSATILDAPPAIPGLCHEEIAWTYMPYLQLCICYDRIGDVKKAEEYNNIALSYSPKHPSMLHNKKYFDNFKENQK